MTRVEQEFIECGFVGETTERDKAFFVSGFKRRGELDAEEVYSFLIDGRNHKPPVSNYGLEVRNGIAEAIRKLDE